MDQIKDAFLAPFSTEAAGRTTHAKVAITYGVAVFALAQFLK